MLHTTIVLESYISCHHAVVLVLCSFLTTSNRLMNLFAHLYLVCYAVYKILRIHFLRTTQLYIRLITCHFFIFYCFKAILPVVFLIVYHISLNRSTCLQMYVWNFAIYYILCIHTYIYGLLSEINS